MKPFDKCLFDCRPEGYIVISRKLLCHLIKSIPEAGPNELYAYMLARANYGETGPEDHRIQRSELALSPAELGKELNLSRAEVYRQEAVLEGENLISKRRKGKRSILVMTEYEAHCGTQVSAAPPKEAQPRKKPSRKEPPPSGYTAEFEEFFAYYHHAMGIPRKDKRKAWEEWLLLTPEEHELAMVQLGEYADASEGQRFKKQAYSYLRDKSFEQ